MSFVEQFSNSQYFKMHPDKVAGKEVKTTSRAFPFSIEGTREDVENMFSFLYRDSQEDLDLIIAIAEAESEMLELLALKGLNGITKGDFGPVFTQFKNKPKEAIRFLMKVKQGEAINALYRTDIGHINIIWGENDPITNKGYGLKHIIEKHGNEIAQLGFKAEDFIPIIVQYGEYNLKKSNSQKRVYDGELFRFVIAMDSKRNKRWLLTAFDLRKKPKL